ncbi:MAG: phenylalanine--tRNA ligase subunit beta [Mycobacteriales bacterium]|nr:phenylalanine--tRNA ligase subunit beta [Mycobacteriales bacterium]
MRVPLSWLRELVPGLTAPVEQVAERLVAAGLEVETIDRLGHDISGVVVGRVVDVEELTGFKKPIRFCHVDSGTRVHDVVCGATNVAAGDVIAFATPGAVLPGGFQIATRQTYGRTSDGMICSAAELGLSDEADGILVLPADTPQGGDVVALLGLRDEVLDIAVTPDRGYVLSVRGVAREAATAFGLQLTDPGLRETPASGGGHEVRLDDPAGCDRYVARIVTGLDPTAPSPAWLQRRLTLCGVRSISLAVDVTNHVMLEVGHPLHAFDLDRLQGAVVVRRAAAGERLTTLDGQDRALDPTDLVITDDSGPIALAGVMGGAATEVTATTTSLLVEAAHFAPATVTRTARRHRLPSEASRRYERGVDPSLAAAAADLAVGLLVDLGGAVAGPVTDVDLTTPRAAIAFPVGAPARTAGRDYADEVVVARLRDVGCEVSGVDPLQVTPPTWRPDLTGVADLVEEVVRLEGYDTVPVVLPPAPSGRGLTAAQVLRRTASRALAASGLVEVANPPFVSERVLEALGARAGAPRLTNPLSEAEALLSPTLLASLLAALHRNAARGAGDVALFQTGRVFLESDAPTAAVPGVDDRPGDDALAALDATLPVQPRHAAVVLAGRRDDRPVDWADAVESALALGRALRLELTLVAAGPLPFHPGRCAAVQLAGVTVGHAGELHPRVVEALELPARTCAAEVDLDRLVDAAVAAGPVDAPVVSSYPPASVDVALVVAADVPAQEVERALRDGAGPLVESVRLFDVYTGPQVGEGHRSLAYALRFRAPDRTLTDGEAVALRDAAVAEATSRVGAVLRGA